MTDNFQLEEQFFNTRFLMSYSGLNKLIFSPSAFYNHYVLNQREDRTDKYMVSGRLIHCLILTPYLLEEEFIVMPGKLPSDNVRKIIDQLFQYYLFELNQDKETSSDIDDYHAEILIYLQQAPLYQTLKTDQQRLDKVLTDDTRAYWKYLISARGKTVIDQETLDFGLRAQAVFLNRGDLMTLFGRFLDSLHPIETYNEIEVVLKQPEKPFDLRGILDNVVVDHELKEIRINDLKNTSKGLQDFPESIQYYKYYLQAAMYYRLTQNLYGHLNYPIVFRFVVIDPYLQIAPVRVSIETMGAWIEELDRYLEQAEWHFQNREFNLPYAFAINPQKELVL